MTLVYLEIKASTCLHESVFFSKAIACTITYLIKVKLLFSALVFTIISYIDLYIMTDYHNLADGGVRCPLKEGFITTMTKNNTIKERTRKVKIREVETRA